MERKHDPNLGEENVTVNETLNIQLRTLANNLKTFYLDSENGDVIHLVELVSRFIEKADENLADILSNAPPTSNSKLLPATNNVSPELKLLLPNLLRATTSFLEDGLHHENSIIRMKIKQILLKEFKNDIPSTDRLAKCFHLYLANVATDIYVHFRIQINQWLKKQQEGLDISLIRANLEIVGRKNRTEQISNFDAVVNYTVKRYFTKLQKLQNINNSKNEVTRQFVGADKTGRRLNNKISRDWDCRSRNLWCLSPKQDSEFRKIFLKPVPDLFFSEEKNTRKSILILKVLEVDGKIYDLNPKPKYLTRPPFEFEFEELIQKTPTSNDKYITYEDPLPLAIQIIEDRKIQTDASQRQKILYSKILNVFQDHVRELECRISQKLGITDFTRRMQGLGSLQNCGDGPGSSKMCHNSSFKSGSQSQSPAQRIMKLSKEVDDFVKSFKKFGKSDNSSVMKKCLEIIFDKIESQNKTAGIGTDTLELFHVISFLAADFITIEVCTRFYYNTLLDKDPSREINSKPKKYKVQHFEKLLKILTTSNLISTSFMDLPEAEANAGVREEWSMNRKITVNSLIQKTTREIFHEKKALSSSNLLKYFCSSLKCDNEIDNILYNEHLTSIADCLLTTNNSPSDDIPIAACIITSKISTEEPVRIMQSLINKIQCFYQEINIHKERKEEIRILEITLNLLQVNGSTVICMNKIEDLIGSVVNSMGMYANNIYLQFVGCSTLKHLLCDHPMRSLISCEIRKDAFRTSLESLLSFLAQSQSQSVNAELNTWILLLKNIFQSYITSEYLFLAENPRDTVKLLLIKYTPNLDTNSDYGFWAGLYNAMYGSKNLPGVDSSKAVAETETSFDENNGITIITNKLEVLTKTYLKFPQQIRNIFGIIIRLSFNYNFAKKLQKNSTDFIISLRACINSFYNVETSTTQGNVGNNNDSRTALKLAIISYAQLSIVIQNPPNRQNYSKLQISAVQKIAKLEESGICFSSGCDYCAEHSRECVLSLLNIFLEIVKEDPLIASEREVNAAKFCIFMCKPLVQQKSLSSVELRSGAVSKDAKSKSIIKYYTQKSEHLSTVPSPRCTEEKCGVTAIAKGKYNTEVVNWIAQFLKVSSNNLNLESLLLSLSEGNANLSEWKPQKLTYLIAITVSTILEQSTCEANSHSSVSSDSNCGTDTQLRFAFNALSSIKWFYYRHNMKMHPIHKFLVHLGLQYYSIFSQFHNTDNKILNSNQMTAFRWSRWNFIQWASQQMDNFCREVSDENILAVRLGGLAVYQATQII